MKIRHLTLFTLRVAHEYYGDAPCRDFDFVIAEHSRQAMKGAKLLSSVQGGRLSVSFEADDNDLPVQHIDGLELLIGLQLRNPSFEYFTGALPEATPFYANTSTARTLDAPLAGSLVAYRYAPVAAATARPLTLSIARMRDALPVWQAEIGNDQAMPVIDTRLWEAGSYEVTQQAGSATHVQPLLVAPDLAATGMWGMVRIVVTADFWAPASQPPDFHVDFAAVEETLDYYVVAPQSWTQAFDHLSISDAAASHKLTFHKYAQTAASNDGIAPSLLGVPDRSRALLFRSIQTVARNAVPAHQLQLKRNGDTLINNLPLPSANTPAARFVVHISKP